VQRLDDKVRRQLEEAAQGLGFILRLHCGRWHWLAGWGASHMGVTLENSDRAGFATATEAALDSLIAAATGLKRTLPLLNVIRRQIRAAETRNETGPARAPVPRPSAFHRRPNAEPRQPITGLPQPKANRRTRDVTRRENQNVLLASQPPAADPQ
jgi:hypothetical protein